MFIAKEPPYTFATGDLLSPAGINQNNNYIISATAFEANKQTARWTTTYQFIQTATSTLTNASSINLRTRNIPTSSFRARNTTPIVTIESVSVLAYYTATAGFKLNIDNAAEVIEFPVRSSTLANEPYQVVRLMNATHTTETLLELVGLTTTALPAGTTITKFDVIVGFASDKYLSGDGTGTGTKPSLIVYNYNDGTFADATTFSSLKTYYEQIATQAKFGQPFRWVGAEFWGIVSTTPINASSVPIGLFQAPSFNNINTNPAVRGIYIEAKLSAATAGNTIQYGWCDNTGAFITNFNQTITLGTGGAQTVTNGLLATNTVRYSPTANLANDRYLSVRASGTVNIEHCTIYLILQ